MNKKLYTVTVEFQYAVLAENEREACEYANDAMQDTGSMSDCATAHETTSMIFKGVEKPLLPDIWEMESLVYGEEELTFEEAWKKYGNKKIKEKENLDLFAKK